MLLPGQPPRPLVLGEMPARARIDRPLVAMRCRQARGDLGARAEARIKQPQGPQPIQRRLIQAEPLRLPHHGPIPAQPEPRQVALDRVDELLAAARAVDILDAQQEASAGLTRPVMRRDRRPGVAEMQQPGRRRCEATDDFGHGDS